MQPEFSEFIQANLPLVLAFIGLIIAIIALEIYLRMRGFEELSSAAVTQRINRDDAQVIDVRSPTEFQSGHIGGAVSIPADQVDTSLKALEKYQERPIIVVCKQGYESPKVARKLGKAGLAPIAILKGGITAWQADNLPVRKGRN